MQTVYTKEMMVHEKIKAIKKRILVQRDWREEFVHKMELIDLRNELKNLCGIKKEVSNVSRRIS